MSEAAASTLRYEAFSLLETLCRDSLDQPLALTLQAPEEGEISAAFCRLFDILEELTADA